MANANISPRVSKAKKLTININREERKNEPNLTLGHLVDLTESIVDAFSPGKRVNFPNTYSLLLLDGNNQEIRARGTSFPLTLTHFKAQEGDGSSLSSIEQKILGQLFPDDIASILKSIQFFIAKEYGERENRTFDWGYEIDSIIHEINSAKDIKSLQTIATGNLKNAAKSTLSIAQGLLEDIVEEDGVDLDDAQLVIDEIENLFRTSDKDTNYRKVWEELGKKPTQSLKTHDRKTKSVTTPDKKFSAQDVRKIINAFYDQIADQIEKNNDSIKKEDGPKEPWDRVSVSTKNRFSSNNAPYFSTNELLELEVNIGDTTKANTFIEWIDQALEELEKEPEEAVVGDGEGEGDGGGEATEEEPSQKEVKTLTLDEITKDAIDALVMRSSKIFFEYFSGAQIDPNKFDQKQQDLLITLLPNVIRELLDEKKIKTRVSEWVINNLELEKEDGDRYRTNGVQFKELNKIIAEQFFAENSDELLSLISSIPSSEELDKETKSVEPDVPTAKTVVPDTDDSAGGGAQGKDFSVSRSQAARDLTTEFLIMQFGEEGEFLRTIVYDLIISYLPENPTRADIIRLRAQIFRKLQLNKEIIERANKYYKTRVNHVTNGNLADAANIYRTIDSIIVLSEDPVKYFLNLSDKDLLEQFGLENSNVDVKQLRILLRGLVTILSYSAGSSITPWFSKDDEHEKIPQALGGVRSFIKKYGEDGAAALNLNEEQVDESTVIDKHRKETIKQLYRNLWISTVAGKSQDELIEIYQYYNVNIVQIDFNALPTPDGFIFSEMAQQANLSGVAGQSKKAQMAKKIFAEGKQKLGKAALGLLAPELAPILASLENLPVVGEMVKEVEEKTGKAILIALGAGAAAIVALIKGGVRALVGAVIGGGIGFVLGFGPVGVLVGAGIGGWLGGGGITKIKNWFSGLGSSGGNLGGGVGQVAHASTSSSAISTRLVPLTLGGVATGAIITTTIAGGTQLYPIEKFNTTDPGTGKSSPFVEIVKSVDPNYLEEPGRVTYTIDISTKGGYSIVVTDALDELKVRYNLDKYPSGVPTPENIIKTIDDFSDLEVETIINDGETLSFTYETDYDSDFQHANVVNFFTLSFDYSNGSDSGSAEAMSLASVKFGEAPIFDGCWPVGGSITQLPFGGYSHSSTTPGYGADGVDIGVDVGTPVYASFAGTAASTSSLSENWGIAVIISGDDGKFIYAHLSAAAVSVGDEVSAGDAIGLSGNTGASSGPHLHYERANSSGSFYATPTGSGSTLLQLHEAIDLREGDQVSRESCGG